MEYTEHKPNTSVMCRWRRLPCRI